MMKAAVLLVAAAGASAQQEAPGELQRLVDGIFERYLPQEQKAHTCPFARIAEQCEQFNATLTQSRACHAACEHGDFKCHLKCPRARPTSVQELLRLGEAMVCHKSCGRDMLCHKTACACPFSRKQAACGKLAEAVECHRRGGNHTSCKLDEDAKELLLAEPWSLVKDVADHLVDFLAPPAQQPATEEEVRGCHAHCGHDAACHRACPAGQRGVLKEQCALLDTAKACHQSCKSKESKCPFKKMACHMKCPLSMPSSVEELKATAEHMACHAECGQDRQCHQSCPKPRQWAEKKERCAEYNRVAACHKGCMSQGHECHLRCPSLHFPDAPQPVSSLGGMVKEVVNSLLI
mmetsp:Transcript_143805/g.400825  ORF Transcript_143805/g.400825 Transcript_143805/m.400825 type:complete len:349 (+) Transcript_143805:93-1139(+)